MPFDLGRWRVFARFAWATVRERRCFVRVALCGVMAGALPFSATARAQAVTLVETGRTEAVPSSPAGLQVEGVRAGLSLAEVRALLGKKYAEADLRSSESTLTAKRDGRAISSAPFVSEIETGDGLDITFSPPTIGSRVIGVISAHTFLNTHSVPEHAPSVLELIARLRHEFGPQSSPQTDPAETRSMIWNFNASGMVPCTGDACSYAKPNVDLAEIPRLTQDLGRDHRLSILVTIRPYASDPKIVSGYVIILEDVANELLSLKEADRQLNAGAAPHTSKPSRGEGRRCRELRQGVFRLVGEGHDAEALQLDAPRKIGRVGNAMRWSARVDE